MATSTWERPLTSRKCPNSPYSRSSIPDNLDSSDVGHTVPDDPPRSIALTFELRNEVCLMGHQHTCTAIVLVIGATINCQVSATRNIYSLIDETDSPQRTFGLRRANRIMGKAHLEALLIGFDPNS